MRYIAYRQQHVIHCWLRRVGIRISVSASLVGKWTVHRSSQFMSTVGKRVTSPYHEDTTAVEVYEVSESVAAACHYYYSEYDYDYCNGCRPAKRCSIAAEQQHTMHNVRRELAHRKHTSTTHRTHHTSDYRRHDIGESSSSHTLQSSLHYCSHPHRCFINNQCHTSRPR